MLTNGFALFSGADAPTMARAAMLRAKRYCKERLVWTGGEFADAEGADLEKRRGAVLAFSLGGDGFPLVHGYAEGVGELPEGEFSLLGKRTSGFYGARGPLGTRGLWVVKRGAGAGSISSDYRLLPKGAVLVPAGALYYGLKERKVAIPREATRRPTFEEAAAELASLIDESVKRRVRGHSRVAVSFSGGLDSSLLALVASKHAEVVLCSAFAPGARDERQSDRAAGLLGLSLEAALLDEETLAARAKQAELPPGDATVMDKALWCIYSAASELAEKRDARLIMLGQLADELFGGYMKYAIAAKERGLVAAETMMAEDVRACADRGFLRDEAACSASCEVRFPFADEKVAALAARIPFGYKVRDGERKAILRAAALRLGLPEELAEAPKKAAQFSSGASKLLSRQ